MGFFWNAKTVLWLPYPKVELTCLPGESVSTRPLVILPAHRHPALPQCPHSLKMIAGPKMCPLQSMVCLKRQQFVIVQRNHLCEPVLRCIALWLAEQKLRLFAYRRRNLERFNKTMHRGQWLPGSRGLLKS